MHNTPSKVTLIVTFFLLSTFAAAGQPDCKLTSQRSIAEVKSQVAGHPGVAPQSYIKDVPTPAYSLQTPESVAALPAAIAQFLGGEDRTKYADLSPYIGSVINMQMGQTNPDFYPIGLDTFQGKYRVVPFSDVVTKNPKLISKLNAVAGPEGQANLAYLISSGALIGILKTVPTAMIRMSEVGFSIDQSTTIESLWGDTQTKPAGQDAWLVWDEGKQGFYMVNSDAQGLPLSYIRPSDWTPQSLAFSKDQLTAKVQASGASTTEYIKDVPIAGFLIQSPLREDIPAAISSVIGAIDDTRYANWAVYNGSFVALQFADSADFYPVGVSNPPNYEIGAFALVGQKNPKLMAKLQTVPGLMELAQAHPERFVSALRLKPATMIRMSDAGFSIDAKVTIESPWGEQTKPAGKDAWLVWDADKAQYYMVNSDENGLPISYVPKK